MIKKDIKKELEEQRKSEEDNVIQIRADPTPPSFDWLRTLPFETRFVSKPINQNRLNPWLEQYGIAMILPKTILLAAFVDGALSMRWVDSRIFSSQNILVEVIPKIELEQPAGEKDG